jgi:hypothetical protein
MGVDKEDQRSYTCGESQNDLNVPDLDKRGHAKGLATRGIKQSSLLCALKLEQRYILLEAVQVSRPRAIQVKQGVSYARNKNNSLPEEQKQIPCSAR